MNFNEENLQRFLGVIWAPDSDCFTFKIDFPKLNDSLVNGKKVPTKREVLRLVMSVFDPLGHSRFTYSPEAKGKITYAGNLATWY